MAGDWVLALGKKHDARERAAELATRATHEGAVEIANRSLERWTHIVAAMTQIAGAYNSAFDRTVLSVAEDRTVPDRPTVTIQAGGQGTPSLMAGLEGTLICVRSRDAQGLSCETAHALRPDRDDDQTAAYVLQHWMQCL